MKDEKHSELTHELARLRKYIETTSLAKGITTAIKNCNLLFRELTKGPNLFREDIQAISVLHQPCSDDSVFLVKLGALAGLFEVSIEEWKPLLKKFEPWMKRGNTLLEKWLDEQEIAYDQKKVKVWDAIIRLRNASFPYHPTSKKLIKLVKFFGQKFPINYAEFSESILRMFLDSLEMLQTVLYNTQLARETATS